MGKTKRAKTPRKSISARKSLNDPEKLSPIPAAAPPEEPQVDEVLTPDEKREERDAETDGIRIPR